MVIKMETLIPAQKIILTGGVLRETFRLIVDSVRLPFDPQIRSKVSSHGRQVRFYSRGAREGSCCFQQASTRIALPCLSTQRIHYSRWVCFAAGLWKFLVRAENLWVAFYCACL